VSFKETAFKRKKGRGGVRFKKRGLHGRGKDGLKLSLRNARENLAGGEFIHGTEGVKTAEGGWKPTSQEKRRRGDNFVVDERERGIKDNNRVESS